MCFHLTIYFRDALWDNSLNLLFVLLSNLDLVVYDLFMAEKEIIKKKINISITGYPSTLTTCAAVSDLDMVVKQMLYSWMIDGYRELKSSKRMNVS